MLVCLYIYNFQTNKQTKSTQILQNSIQGKLPNSRLPKLMQIIKNMSLFSCIPHNYSIS